MHPFKLFKAHGKVELDVTRRISIVGQLNVVVKTVHVLSQPQCVMPFDSGLLPVSVPLCLRAWLDKKLHLHLLKLPHAENELTGYDLVAKRLANLCDSKGDFHPPTFLHIEEIDKNPLGRFWTQVDDSTFSTHRSQFRLEHQIELAHVRPIAASCIRISNVQIFDQLLDGRQVLRFHG